jgi:hypothetical protein
MAFAMIVLFLQIKLSKTADSSIATRDRLIAEFVNLHLQKILQRKQCPN